MEIIKNIKPLDVDLKGVNTVSRINKIENLSADELEYMRMQTTGEKNENK